jgi:hypothetical protein
MPFRSFPIWLFLSAGGEGLGEAISTSGRFPISLSPFLSVSRFPDGGRPPGPISAFMSVISKVPEIAESGQKKREQHDAVPYHTSACNHFSQLLEKLRHEISC